MRVLDQDHPAGVKRGHIWAFVGAELVAFLYAPDWRAKHPAALLQGFTGYLQGDGYAGYGAMLRGEDGGEVIVPEERRLGCGMHIRAKFEKAAKGGDARAAVALAYFKAIYRIEAACKAEALSAEARMARRQELSLPVVDELYQWIHELHLRLVPSTTLYVATQYAINQEAAWRRCFTDGRFEIDNGEVERRIRCVALGRKNYLFAGSDKGAQRLAVGYTVFGSCRMHGVNPLAWATDVIGKLQGGWPRERLDELLPDAWARASLTATAAGDTDPS
ncbi:IS66 family transposase [Sorangium sp. So ce341]